MECQDSGGFSSIPTPVGKLGLCSQPQLLHWDMISPREVKHGPQSPSGGTGHAVCLLTPVSEPGLCLQLCLLPWVHNQSLASSTVTPSPCLVLNHSGSVQGMEQRQEGSNYWGMGKAKRGMQSLLII